MLKIFWKIVKSIAISATKYYQEFCDRPHHPLDVRPTPLDVGYIYDENYNTPLDVRPHTLWILEHTLGC